jgi:hypothetical protein
MKKRPKAIHAARITKKQLPRIETAKTNRAEREEGKNWKTGTNVRASMDFSEAVGAKKRGWGRGINSASSSWRRVYFPVLT